MESIYIPNGQNVNNIKIKHYMYTHDVALKCNGVNDNDKRIIWIDSKLTKPKFTFMAQMKNGKCM